MRFLREEPPAHRITIPDHKELRAGTLKQIPNDVSGRLGMTSDELLGKLMQQYPADSLP